MSESGQSKRDRWNIWMFILSYAISNLVGGMIYDTYVNYLQEVSRSVATSFWAFYGYATFLSALILTLVPRTGYKKLLLFCAVSSVAALLSVIYLNVSCLFSVTTLLSLVGLQLHYIMLAPYIASYTDSSNNILWYTRTYYIGYMGYFISMFLGGAMTVKLFSVRLHDSYQSAKLLTEYVDHMTPGVKAAYLQGNKDLLLITAVIAALALIPVSLIQEETHSSAAVNPAISRKNLISRVSMALKSMLSRDAMIYLTYWLLISFGMGLIISYFTVFLNRNLHIDKATSSFLVSLSYLAIVLFMLFTPYLVRRLGKIVTLGGVALCSIPFLLIIANGDRFGRFTVPMVGIALFMRSGLMNLGSPADSALAMELAPEELRPAFASVLNCATGLASIASGLFTGKILFVVQEGYRTAYYITACVYAAACILILVGLWKYNRTNQVED